MAKTKKEKKETVEKIRKNLEEQVATFFVNFEGLSADDLFELREKLKQKGNRFYVAKKNLMEIAFEKENLPFKKELLSGPVGLVFGFQDEITPAKTVYEFEKRLERPRILGGVVEGKSVLREEALELAKLPSLEELRAELTAVLQAPISGLDNCLSGNLKGLLNSLDKIKG